MRCYRDFRRKRTPESLLQTGVSHRQNGLTENGGGSRPASGRSLNSQSPNSAPTPMKEKPSVTWVMICLFIMSAFIICTSAALYHHVEGWTYVESIYFAFVSYATIGFGDFVTLQHLSYGGWEIVYRLVAFGVMVFGCCCIYSLLNVTSIVIKRFLNWIINTLDCPCCFCCGCLTKRIQRNLSSRRRTARSQRQVSNSKYCKGNGGNFYCLTCVNTFWSYFSNTQTHPQDWIMKVPVLPWLKPDTIKVLTWKKMKGDALERIWSYSGESLATK